MKYRLICWVWLGLMACKKESATPATLLVGTWRLTNYCGPGPSSCVMTAIPSDKSVMVTFTGDGKFSENYGNGRFEGYGFIGCAGTYVYEGNDIRLFPLCSSSSNGRLIRLISVSRNQLRLMNGQVGEYVLTR